MKLYIAEKPSLGRAIVEALPKPHHKADGCVYVGHQDKARCDVVSWCVGHLLEQAEPDHYDSALKKWSFQTLPIVPEKLSGQWKLKPKRQTSKQLNLLKKLVRSADQIVHCGDPDREGQLLVDEVLHYCKVPDSKLQHTQRCLISDLNLPAVRRSLSQLKSNQDYASLSISALARSRADWLYGMNLTRAFTLQAKNSGYSGLISVGRVQTPVLGLVVRRDQEIENFVHHDYFQVDAHLSTGDQQIFKARWQPSEACEKYTDSEGRVTSKALAENVASRIKDKPAKVENYLAKDKSQSSPLPFNLSNLQIEAAKSLGMNAKAVLDICQSLYEQHKLITYPRSDCRYLPEEHFGRAEAVVAAISSNAGLTEICKQANVSMKGRVWNDKKVGAHHAIIPTEKAVKIERLSKAEQQIYMLIARQYLMQFYAAWRYCDVQADIRIEGGLFIAKARVSKDLGWKVLLVNDGKQANPGGERNLPELKIGQILHCFDGEVLQKTTEAPKPFTDASLLAAMTGIARFVKDAELKKILKETDGLGTEATRAGIIDLLFKRQFLVRKGKAINATPLGKVIINNLPDNLSLADMTALWEQQLGAISEKTLKYDDFMQPLLETVSSSIRIAESQPIRDVAGLQSLPSNRKFSRKKASYKKRSNASAPPSHRAVRRKSGTVAS